MTGLGLDYEFDYEQAFHDDASVEDDVMAEIEDVKLAVEGLLSVGGSAFQITGDETTMRHSPDTEEWQKAIGSYDIWSSADVKVDGDAITMRIAVHAEDRYNFKPGAKDRDRRRGKRPLCRTGLGQGLQFVWVTGQGGRMGARRAGICDHERPRKTVIMVPAARWRLVAMSLLCIVTAVGCGDAEPAQPRASASASGSSSGKSGIQPNEALKPGAGDRVPATLLGPKLDIEGLTLVPLDSEWMDDVVTYACGNRSGNGVYRSRQGQRREWQAPGIEVQQFAGVFGAITAAEAVTQGHAKLTCDTYQDREGTHRLLGEVAVPVGPPIDGHLAFCEVDNEGTADTTYSCTALLSREDIATRIQVKARSESQARQVVQELRSLAAQALGKAW